jgi:hypothetical protein
MKREMVSVRVFSDKITSSGLLEFCSADVPWCETGSLLPLLWLLFLTVWIEWSFGSFSTSTGGLLQRLRGGGIGLIDES